MSNVVIGPVSISEPITACGFIIKTLRNVVMINMMTMMMMMMMMMMINMMMMMINMMMMMMVMMMTL